MTRQKKKKKKQRNKEAEQRGVAAFFVVVFFFCLFLFFVSRLTFQLSVFRQQADEAEAAQKAKAKTSKKGPVCSVCVQGAKD